ncbi:MAG TPA: 5'-3' exonuclease H3TH domain-containing protein, partial [Clostridia bacterium]|nr:5'-3' exonuclease H3TH domain-containing protein [Clostridia bacterium]
MLLVIDGNSIMNRAFYALPLSLNSGAVPTNAVYGFMNVFYKAIDTYNPDCVLVAFDMPGATFRHEKYEAYKQGRKAAPEELSQQFPVIKELLKTAGIRIQEVPGYEADDIIGTVVRKAEFAGMESIILSGDRDSLQLISEKTRVLLVKKGISYTELTDADTLHETMGITPRQVIDFKALAGDASDNIPGVPGVGEKTALKLLQDYSDLDEIYKNIDSIPGKLGEKLAQGKESAYLSRELATIYTSVPLDYEPSQCIYRNPSGQKVRDLYMRLGLRSLLSRVGEAPQGQLSLEFDSTAEEEEYETLTDIRLLTGEYLALCAEGDKITCSPDGKSVYALENGLEDLFKNNPGLADKKIIAHDIKSMMHKYNLRFNSYFDTMVAEYLIDANAARYTPERLLAKYSLKYALNA